MFKSLFENLIVVLTGVEITVPVECLAVILSLVMVTILVNAMLCVFMPNSKKYIRLITLIIIVVICICTLATYDISVINITQNLPTGGVA